LLYFERIPPQKLEPAGAPHTPDWSPLFGAAGLDAAQFQSTEPLWTWLATSDVRAAWTGVWPGTTQSLRVEAAALRGQPVAFSMIGPWSTADRMPRGFKQRENTQIVILIVVVVVVMFGTMFLMRRNLRKGGGDDVAATRLASWVGIAQIGLWLLRSHLAASMGTVAMFFIAIATAIFYAYVVRTMYLALEPHVRRRWPQCMISWTAVLAGRWRDPIVGRDVLAGVVLAIIVRLINVIANLILPVAGSPDLGATNALNGIRSTLSLIMTGVPHGVRDTLLFFFVIFILRILLRNQWLAIGGFMLIFAAQNALQSDHPLIDGTAGFIVFGMIAGVVFRFGLLALAAFIFLDSIVSGVQVTANPSAWYFTNDLLLLAGVLALAGWAFHTSIAGRRLWKHDLLD
jgi:hypothetical protein